jgi:hypothetical protein
MKKFTCLCDEGFSGETCQDRSTSITITFHQVSIPLSILGHFITVYDNASHTRITIFKKILFNQDSVPLYMSNEFHLLFTQIVDDYYLTIAQEKSMLSSIIRTKIIPSQRCSNISELFNSSVLEYNYLRRVKLYHLACQNQIQLKCFYDKIFMCLCNTDRFANCFQFNHSTTYDCQESHFCENDAQCFQDKPTCPTEFICVCSECFYGTHCQFSTKTFALSLDAILGYKIQPNTRFTQQTITIKLVASIVASLFVLGIVNSLLSIITFQTKTPRKVGCGLYLLSTSIISLLTIIIFSLKFSILIYTQISSNTSRSFLLFSCKSTDFLLRVLVSTTDWFNACVAIERAITVFKDVNFDQEKSKYISKWIIIFVILFTTFSTIHDPLYRRLIDDTEEQRTWCITSYSSILKIYDSISIFVHFLVPFFINIISVIVIIVNLARQQSILRKKQTYKQHLYKQLDQNKHLLIAPCILVLSAIPRLVLSLLSVCMRSPRDPWRFLIGYLLSFIPFMLTFPVFILPSIAYKKEFCNTIKHLN